jgi:hypothetical protein
MKKLLIFIIIIIIGLPVRAYAAGGTLNIDTATRYDGMTRTYAEGYVPTVSGGSANFILPLKCPDTSIMSITVTPVIGTDDKTPFSYGNYEFDVTRSSAIETFVIRLSLPLKPNRFNGTYPVVFRVRYTDSSSNVSTQEYPIYLTIDDGIDPNAPDPVIISSQLCIDSSHLYPGMAKTYANGYMPIVQNNSVSIVLPLQGATYDNKVMMTAELGDPAGTPFIYSNYAQTATGAGAYLLSLDIPLLPGRINGSYPVVLNVSCLNAAGSPTTQTFTVYVNITDGKSPDPVEKPPVGQLNIDGSTLYDGMDKTYAQGYVPKVTDGKVTIVLPLIGSTYSGDVSLTADLGPAAGSPFTFGNYGKSLHGDGCYVFTLEIPLSDTRINGIYPVALNVEYLDSAGSKATQAFPVYVTIADGQEPADPNAKPIAEVPQLFVSKCVVTPDTISGDMEFSVDLTVSNIGNISARGARLSYGSEAAGIMPAQTNNNLLLGTITSGAGKSVKIKFKTTADVLAGAQSFSIILDYGDIYGSTYNSVLKYLIKVTQPAEISYDPVSIPQSVVSGGTVPVPVNIFNTGKSTLRNVTVSISGAGLFPVSSAFLGDIKPGEAGNGTINLLVGMLSMTPGYTDDYGSTNGKCTIIYTDDKSKQHKIENKFSTEIIKPADDGESDKDNPAEEPAFQWWITILVAFAIISVVVSITVVSKVMRASQMQLRPGIMPEKNKNDHNIT